MVHLVRTTEGGPSRSDEEVQLFEAQHGIKLPRQFRDFLLVTNGRMPERDLFQIDGFQENPHGRIHVFFGLNDPVESCNLDWNLRVFEGRIPGWLLPIATTEGSDKICLATSGGDEGGIYYWDAHAPSGTNSAYLLADDFGTFVSSLQSDEVSPRIRRS
ncbi:SMI1/KNR4 family protein [Corallococcus terminator]